VKGGKASAGVSVSTPFSGEAAGKEGSEFVIQPL